MLCKSSAGVIPAKAGIQKAVDLPEFQKPGFRLSPE
jgi:hypothetical protein